MAKDSFSKNKRYHVISVTLLTATANDDMTMSATEDSIVSITGDRVGV